jgi:Domain of unknown function (DUF4352)
MSGLYFVKLKACLAAGSWLCLSVLLVVFGSISCTRKSAPPANSAPASSPGASPDAPVAVAPKKVFQSGEAVPAGYLGFKVLGSWFKDQPAKDGKKATVLFVDLAVVNTDKKERALSPIKLVDETGKEYALSESAGNVEHSIKQVGNVPPSQSKRVTAVYDAPRGHQYSLKIQGFSNTDEVEIKLAPAAAPPAK